MAGLTPAEPERAAALSRAKAQLHGGPFLADLARRVALRTESQNPAQAAALRHYLEVELAGSLAALGFESQLHDNPQPGGGPFLIARRLEDPQQPTVLMYGHGDVIRGQDSAWTCGQGPWALAQDGERLYGRGTADNKGQHSINLAALAAVLAAREGRLGFNLTLLFETSEETGSPGLHEFCTRQQDALRADLFIASDGPRLGRNEPTLFLGSRGVANFELRVKLRDGAHHSGNWGGLLRNPGIRLAHALASLVGAQGQILPPALRPPPIPAAVRAALVGLQPGVDLGDPAIDPTWGEPGLSPAERLYGFNSLEVLAFKTGNPDHPVNAIPDQAWALMHLRFVPGTPVASLQAALQAHLDAQGFDDVHVGAPTTMAATRLDPTNPWVAWALGSMQHSTGETIRLLPNLGGSLPNDVFADILGLPTLWVPHSYPACNQHAPNEHLLLPVVEQGLALMAGLFWDLGEAPAREIWVRERKAA